ncbi:WD repeat-containing protein 83 [Mortierella sp. AD010]|nr:WD repeat-containing protein 83 [Mortierella sp. AD010]
MPKSASRMPAPPTMSIAATLAAHRNKTDKPRKSQSAARQEASTSTGISSNSSQSAIIAQQSHSATSNHTPTSLQATSRLKAQTPIERTVPSAAPSSSSSSISLPIYEDNVISDATGSQINACQYNSTGEYILTGGVDRVVRLWNPTTRFCIKTYEAHGWEVLDLAVSPENGKFASCGGDKSVFLWDVLSGTTIRRFPGHTQRVNAVDFNDEGTARTMHQYDYGTAGREKTSQLKTPIQIMDEPKDSVTSIQIQGADLLAGCVDGSIRIYDIRMGSLTTDQIFEPITSVSFSKDGNCILASSLDNTVRLMDRADGGLLNAYKGHKNSQYKIRSCLSNTDAHVISGSEDGKIYIWDLMEGKVIHEIEAHSKIVSSVAYHPTEEKMCSASVDGSVKTWTSQAAS